MTDLTMIQREEKLMDKYERQLLDIYEQLDRARREGRNGLIEKMLYKRHRIISKKFMELSNKHLALQLY